MSDRWMRRVAYIAVTFEEAPGASNVLLRDSPNPGYTEAGYYTEAGLTATLQTYLTARLTETESNYERRAKVEVLMLTDGEMVEN